MFETIDYTVKNQVGTIVLNRPQVMNAINLQLRTELYEALKSAESDSNVRALILTGVGKAFCSGQDLSEGIAMQQPLHLGDLVRESYNLLIQKMQNMQIPIIAAINGAAAGAGFGLALACDVRFASAAAKFTMAFNKIGLAPDSGTSYFLSRIVGVAKALEWTWTAESIPAQTAFEQGIVNRLTEPQDLMEETYRFAEQLAAGPTLALGLTKQAFYANFSSSLEEALEREAALQEIAGQSRDFREGVSAFLEKRRPNYLGQ